MAQRALEANPAGRGWVQDWYLDATGTERVAAPRIEHAARRFGLHQFEQVRRGRLKSADTLVAGFGVRPKGHPDRARLSGRVDEAFVNSDAALPDDFDFAVWNAAWPEQCDHLRGDEIIELTNLCAPDAPAATLDGQGNTLLRLSLPGQTAHLVVRLQAGEVFQHPMQLDTLLVEPERCALTLVWRAVLPMDDDEPIRALQAHALNAERSQGRQREIKALADAMVLPGEHTNGARESAHE